MSNIISDSVSKVSAITDQTPIDWDAFDSILKGLEDINAYDEYYEETILSEFIMEGLVFQECKLRGLFSMQSKIQKK